MRYAIRSIDRGTLGPWLEKAHGMTKGGVITFDDPVQARAYASNARFRGEVQPYTDNLPTVDAVKGSMGWTYK